MLQIKQYIMQMNDGEDDDDDEDEEICVICGGNCTNCGACKKD